MDFNKLKQRYSFVFQYLLIVAIATLLAHCANPIAPTGGPKDVAPPKALAFKPDNYQPNFSSQTVSITFDEYFTLNNVNDNIIISPILNPKPTFKAKGKNLSIDFSGCTLKENTTYNIWFGEAIKDLNEGNILPNFSYVFSTGAHVDSLEIGGLIQDAFSLKAKEKVFVMLYACENDTIPCDSLPYLVRPDYIAQTASDGSFLLKNLADKPYRIFGLADANRNFLYDNDEEIAFLDSLIIPLPACTEHPTDTAGLLLPADTLSGMIADSLQMVTDTLKQHHHHHPQVLVDMFMFKEVDSVIRVTRNKVIDSVQASIAFSRPAQDVSFSLWQPDSINIADSLPWNVEIWSSERDSLVLWMPYFANDSVKLFVNQGGQVFDTLEFLLKKPGRPSLRQPRKETASDSIATKKPALGISGSQGKIPFFSKLELTFGAPVYTYTMEHAQFFSVKDSVLTPVPMPELETIGSFFQKASLQYSFQENSSWQLMIPEGAFTDIFGHKNDSLTLSFSTDASNSYGNLNIDFTMPDNTPQVVVQLLTEREALISEFVVRESQKLDFGYLTPQKTKLKIIYDTNENGKWDAGNYSRKLQPERVRYYEKVIEIRANWIIEEPVSLKEKPHTHTSMREKSKGIRKNNND